MGEVYAEIGEMTTGGGKERRTMRKKAKHKSVACVKEATYN
jgi:hypothetical protein